jgi:ADP-L-glycero-D-manno-heptose 6-epimerase
MMRDNFDYSRRLLAVCQRAAVPFIYASSAAVYGANRRSAIDRQFEQPLNLYARSKLLFDEHVRAVEGGRVVGLRYFNVYGPREAHKGPMASMVFQLHRQLRATGRMRLFRGTEGVGDGEHRRDFVHVDDVVRVLLWCWEDPQARGLFNVGTGTARSFNELARAVQRGAGPSAVEYIPFPAALQGAYQSFTQAELETLRAAGCDVGFRALEQGVRETLDFLDRAEEPPSARPRHVLVDRDGVLNRRAPSGWVLEQSEWQWQPGALEALRLLHEAGVRVTVVTNQSCIGRGLASRAQVDALHGEMVQQAARAGGCLADVVVCPHGPDSPCACRKPMPGMLLHAVGTSGIRAADTVLVGDDARDLQAAARAGMRSLGVGALVPAEGQRVFETLRAAVRYMLREGGTA